MKERKHKWPSKKILYYKTIEECLKEKGFEEPKEYNKWVLDEWKNNLWLDKQKSSLKINDIIDWDYVTKFHYNCINFDPPNNLPRNNHERTQKKYSNVIRSGYRYRINL